MLPIHSVAAPPALVRAADEPRRTTRVLQEFRDWISRESARGVPLLNSWLPQSASAPGELPGATVIVWGDLPPLETETQEVLRLTVAWMIANRFHGRPPATTTMVTFTPDHARPGYNRIAGSVPLGWRHWR